jgi:aminopeptidase YwaD
MELLERLNRIASADQTVRRSEVLSMLREMDAPFLHYRQKIANQWPENIVVRFQNDSPSRYVIGAHYDSVPGSTGANDNGAGVAILLGVVHQLIAAPPAFPLDIVFFDLEEGEVGGNLAYLENVDSQSIMGMLNLDICGVGDTVVAAFGSHLGDGCLRAALDATMVSEQHPLRIIGRLPPGDDRIFEGRGVPTITACVLPENDIQPLVELVHFMDNGGSPPLQKPMILNTFHNASQDKVEVIQESAMQTMYVWVLDFIAQLQRTITQTYA